MTLFLRASLLLAVLPLCGCGGCSKTNTVLSPPLPPVKSTGPALVIDPEYQGVISKLEKRGASIEVLEEESDDKPQLMISFPQHQADDDDMELVKRLRVMSLNLKDSKVTDRGLANLKDLMTLKVLTLDGTPITDRGLEHLSKLTAFRTLSLGNQHISDAGMAHLKGFIHLTAFSVASDQITDQGLAYLRANKNLTSLVIDSPKITDAGLDNLKDFIHLGFLGISSPGITDKGLEKVSRLTNLYELTLSGCTNITDAGLAYLEDLPRLRNFYLENCPKITDAAVGHLKSIGDPQTLDLKGTSITEAGVKALKDALPRVHIIR